MVQKCIDRNDQMRNPDKPKATVRDFAWYEHQAAMRREALKLKNKKNG